VTEQVRNEKFRLQARGCLKKGLGSTLIQANEHTRIHRRDFPGSLD
jgi:hypothetical protein